MKPRLDALQIPATPRYFAVEIEGKDVHHFRLPAPERCYSLGEWWADGQQQGVAAGLSARAVHLRTGAAIVGACWWHRGLEIEAAAPLILTDESLRAYSLEVQEELVDAGYTVPEILRLSAACMRALNGFIREAEGIEEVMGNGESPGDTDDSASP